MNNKVAIAVICTVLLMSIAGAAPLPAQEEPSEAPLVLTLPDAIQMALERNYDLQIADSRTQEAKAAYGEAAAADRFQLSLAGTYLRLGPVASMTLPPELGGGAIKLGDDKTWNAGLSAYQSLYSTGRNEALRALARAGSATATLSAATARRQITLATTELFYGIVQAQGLQGVAQQNEQRADEQFRIAAARVKAGAAPQFDQLRAEVDVANAHQQVIAAATAVAKVSNQLKNLLAIDLQRPVEIKPQPQPEPISPDPYACRQMALANREEIKIARQGLAIAEQNMRLARAARGVNLSAIASYTRQNATGFGEDYSWAVGVQASKPLIDGGNSRSKQDQSRQQLRQAEIGIQQVTELVALDVSQALLALDEAKAKLASTAKTVEQAEAGLRLAQIRYEAGVGRPVEVTDARTALAAAETNHVNAVYSYGVAEAQLARAVGVPASELPVTKQ